MLISVQNFRGLVTTIEQRYLDNVPWEYKDIGHWTKAKGKGKKLFQRINDFLSLQLELWLELGLRPKQKKIFFFAVESG